MKITPVYYCRNCKKSYQGAALEIPNSPIDKLTAAARYSLGASEHTFRIAGKTIQLSDLHLCASNNGAQEIGFSNFIKLEVEKEEPKKPATR